MKRHRPQMVRAETCPKQGKRRFLSRQDARAVARHYGHASIYRCETCGDYHVTHFTEREQKAIRLLMPNTRRS